MMELRRDDLATSKRLRLIFEIVCVLIAAGCAAVALHVAWRWPLCGDEGIFHLIVFALERGAKPYSDIKDLNFPGAYFLDAFVMKIFGGGDAGERAYDLLLCLVAGLGLLLGVDRGTWAKVGALLAGSLFVLIHLQDGLAQEGQRDFAMASLALLACGLYLCLPNRRATPLIAFQLLVGAIVTIKPTLVLLFFVPLLVAAFRKDTKRQLLEVFGISLGCVAVAPMMAGLWLLHEHASSAFVQDLMTMGTLHAELPRRGLMYLCLHAGSPVAALTAIWLLLVIVNRSAWGVERIVTTSAVVCGFASYLLQGKGLSYQRYPFLGLMLLALFVEIEQARVRSKAWELLALVTYAVVGLWLCPSMLHKVRSFEAVAPFETALQTELEAAGLASHPSVQCLDTFSGCLTTLYEMGTVQSTGYLYDCYLFNGGGSLQVEYRERYLAELERNLPRAIIVTDQNCFQPDLGFHRVNQWRELSGLLADRYTLKAVSVSDREYLLWNRRERRPGFEVYILR